MFQNSFLSLAQQKKLRCERFLEEMEKIIPWEKFCDAVQPFYTENEMGRKRMELVLWGFAKVRYKGLFKNTMQLFTLFFLANLFRVRKTLLATV